MNTNLNNNQNLYTLNSNGQPIQYQPVTYQSPQQVIYSSSPSQTYQPAYQVQSGPQQVYQAVLPQQFLVMSQPQPLPQPIYQIVQQQPTETITTVTEEIIEEEVSVSEEEDVAFRMDENRVPVAVHGQTLEIINEGNSIKSKLKEKPSLYNRVVTPLLGLLSYEGFKLLLNKNFIQQTITNSTELVKTIVTKIAPKISHKHFHGKINKIISQLNKNRVSQIVTVTENQNTVSKVNSIFGHHTQNLLAVDVLGLIGLIASAYFLKNAISELIELKNEKSVFNEHEEVWVNNQQFYSPENIEKINQVGQTTESALDHLINQKIQEVALLTLGMAGQGAVLVGAGIGSGALLTAGTTIGAVVFVASILKMGYDYYNDQNTVDAKEIKSRLNDWKNNTVSTFTPNIQQNVENEILATV